MIFEEAFASLLNHANLPSPGTDDRSQHRSLSAAFKVALGDLDELMTDLLSSANVIAAELSRGRPDAGRLRMQAAYAISCVLADGLRCWPLPDAMPQAHRHLAALAYALSQLLAGDVVDLLEGFEPPSGR